MPASALIAPDTWEMAFFINFHDDFRQDMETRLRKEHLQKSVVHQVDALLNMADETTAKELQTMPWPELVNLAQTEEPESDWFDEDDNIVHLAGMVWRFIPRGFRMNYHCSLVSACGHYQLRIRLGAASKGNPNAYLTIGSAPFWLAEDPMDPAYWALQQLERALGEPLRPNIPGRVDMAMHTQAISIEHLKHDGFVTKARTACEATRNDLISLIEGAILKDRWEIENGDPDQAKNALRLLDKIKAMDPDRFAWFWKHDPQQIAFGSRKNLYCRIYRKDREIRSNPDKAIMFREIWQSNGFDLDNPVINVEFEMRRDWFREGSFNVQGEETRLQTNQDVIDHWQHLASFFIGIEDEKQGWLRLVDIESASRIERAQVAKEWQQLRSNLSYIAPVDRTRIMQKSAEMKTKRDVRQLSKAATRFYVVNGLEVPDQVKPETIIAYMDQLVQSDHRAAAWIMQAINEEQNYLHAMGTNLNFRPRKPKPRAA